MLLQYVLIWYYSISPTTAPRGISNTKSSTPGNIGKTIVAKRRLRAHGRTIGIMGARALSFCRTNSPYQQTPCFISIVPPFDSYPCSYKPFIIRRPLAYGRETIYCIRVYDVNQFFILNRKRDQKMYGVHTN